MPRAAWVGLVAALVAWPASAGPVEGAKQSQKKRYVSSQAYYHALRAELALAKNDLVQAAEELQLALVYDTDSSFLTVQLASVSLKLGWISKAEKQAEKALVLDATNSKAWLLRAHVYLAKNQPQLAERALRKAIEVDPSGVDASIELARLVAKRGRDKEAIAILERAADRNKRASDPFVELAQLEVGKRRLRSAARALERALERDPRRVEVAASLVKIYERQAQYDEASKMWRKIVELVPGDLDAMLYAARAELWVDRDDLAEQHVASIQAIQRGPETDQRLGVMFLEEGRAAQSSVLLAEAMRTAPADQRARFAYAVALAQLGKDEAALAELELIGPDHELYVDARVRIGNILLGLGRSDRAKLAVRSALDQKPNAAGLIAFAAVALERSGQLEEALRTLREARRAMPADLELAQAEALMLIRAGDRDRGTRLFRTMVDGSEDALFRLAEVYERAGEGENAVDTIKQLIREFPDSARGLNLLGYLWAERAVRLDDADKLVRRALALEPRSGAVLDSLGWIAFKRGQLEEAERFLRRASRLSPNDPIVLEHYGDVLLARRKSEPAREAYVQARSAIDRAVLAREPEADQQATRVRRKLAEIPGPARAEP